MAYREICRHKFIAIWLTNPFLSFSTTPLQSASSFALLPLNFACLKMKHDCEMRHTEFTWTPPTSNLCKCQKWPHFAREYALSSLWAEPVSLFVTYFPYNTIKRFFKWQQIQAWFFSRQKPESIHQNTTFEVFIICLQNIEMVCWNFEILWWSFF